MYHEKKFNVSTKSHLMLLFIGLFGLVNTKIQAQCQANFTYNVGPNGPSVFL
jgi:hypothetical protein